MTTFTYEGFWLNIEFDSQLEMYIGRCSYPEVEIVDYEDKLKERFKIVIDNFLGKNNTYY